MAEAAYRFIFAAAAAAMVFAQPNSFCLPTSIELSPRNSHHQYSGQDHEDYVHAGLAAACGVPDLRHCLGHVSERLSAEASTGGGSDSFLVTETAVLQRLWHRKELCEGG